MKTKQLKKEDDEEDMPSCDFCGERVSEVACLSTGKDGLNLCIKCLQETYEELEEDIDKLKFKATQEAKKDEIKFLGIILNSLQEVGTYKHIDDLYEKIYKKQKQLKKEVKER